MYNDTISNSGQGVHINRFPGDDTTGSTPFEATLLNNTFYNDIYAVQTIAPAFDGKNSLSIVELAGDEQHLRRLHANRRQHDRNRPETVPLQYNLFYNNTTNLRSSRTIVDFEGNVGAIYGRPRIRGACRLRRCLRPKLRAGADLAGDQRGPQRNRTQHGKQRCLSDGHVPDHTAGQRSPHADADRPKSLTGSEQPGRLGESSEFGFGFVGGITDPRQILTLPGSGYFNFPDEWAPTLHRRLLQLRRRRPLYHRNVQLRTGHRPAGYSGLHPLPAGRQHGYRLRQQSVHRHRCLSVREPEPARGHRRHRDADPGSNARQLLQRGRDLGRQPDAVDDQHHVQRPDLAQHAQRQHGPARRPGQQPEPAARPGHQPLRQDLLPELDRHAGHQPGGRRFDAGNRRLPDHPVRQRIAGDHQPPGRGTRRREYRGRLCRPGRNWLFPRATATRAATSTTRSSSTRRRRRSRPDRSPWRRPATPTSSATTSRRRHYPPSTARSASPTPTLVPVVGQTVDPRRWDRIQRRDLLQHRPGRPPIWTSSSARTPAPRLDHDRRRLRGHGRHRRSQYRARDQHQRPGQPVRHLQCRDQRRPVALARHRQRLLRGTRPGHRPERQPVESRRSQRPGAVRRR